VPTASEPAGVRRAGRRRTPFPARYSALGLLRRGLTHQDWPAVWTAHPLRSSYDVVIIGGGVHGLAAAYYLAARHGINSVAVLDQGYIGSGGSGRNTAILRSNYLTPEGVRFYDRSLQLYRDLAAELDFNVMVSRRGHLTLAHSDSSLRTMRWRAEVNKAQGVDSEMIGPAEVKRLRLRCLSRRHDRLRAGGRGRAGVLPEPEVPPSPRGADRELSRRRLPGPGRRRAERPRRAPTGHRRHDGDRAERLAVAAAGRQGREPAGGIEVDGFRLPGLAAAG
jgi:hypothetical protein